jgi:hypothetical protein
LPKSSSLKVTGQGMCLMICFFSKVIVFAIKLAEMTITENTKYFRCGATRELFHSAGGNANYYNHAENLAAILQLYNECL